MNRKATNHSDFVATYKINNVSRLITIKCLLDSLMTKQGDSLPHLIGHNSIIRYVLL